MIILPAIDMIDGKVVRLTKGDYSQKTVYGDDPAKVAESFCDKGAEMIHLVDLDGAKAGYPVNTEQIKDICRRADAPVEVGGGIRNLETIQKYFDLGVAQVVLGTAAIENPDFVLSASDLFPDRILVGIDIKDGKPATKGWLETVDIDPIKLANRFADMGASGVIFTDISRDGMNEGANVTGLRDFAKNVDLPVTASGGVTTLDDIRAISKLSQFGVTSAIVGKAIYDGKIDLAEAIKVAREP